MRTSVAATEAYCCIYCTDRATSGGHGGCVDCWLRGADYRLTTAACMLQQVGVTLGHVMEFSETTPDVKTPIDVTPLLSTSAGKKAVYPSHDCLHEPCLAQCAVTCTGDLVWAAATHSLTHSLTTHSLTHALCQESGTVSVNSAAVSAARSYVLFVWNIPHFAAVVDCVFCVSAYCGKLSCALWAQTEGTFSLLCIPLCVCVLLLQQQLGQNQRQRQ